jgi:hypothetical protein
MTIRTFRPGDEVAQVGIYNEAAAALPKFKPATIDEIRRRCRAADFDAATRFFAVENGRPVGYATFHANGRVSYPWCRTGFESQAGPLLEAVLRAMRERGIQKAFAAYRGDWQPMRDFFLAHGFAPVREMVNFVVDFVELPTPSARATNPTSPLTIEDLPAVFAMCPQALRVDDLAGLERHLFHNPYFGPADVIALRSRTDRNPLAVGILIGDESYANPKQLDAQMPCFRLGAFGTEGMQVKRVAGLFSFLARADRDPNQLALDLIGHATARLQDTQLETLAAQVPSDVPHLLRVYQSHFRRQGSFPVYERAI